jgi:hypothetical protein
MRKYTVAEISKYKTMEDIKKIALEFGIKYKSIKTTKEEIIQKIKNQNNEPLSNTENIAKNQNVDNNNKVLHIQINRLNLLDYFGSAIIYPVNYESRDFARNQRTKDIQLLNPDHLLLSEGFTDNAAEDQVLIELSLTDFDKKNLAWINECTCLLSYPLPISRVNKIYFSSVESQKNSLATAKTFQDAYLPEHLFDLWDLKFVDKVDKKVIKSKVNAKLEVDKLNFYNRALGMLSFMKNAELYYCNETEKFSLYNENYFKVLRLINKFFEIPEITEFDESSKGYYSVFLKLREDNSLLQDIINEIYSDETFRKEIFKRLLKSPSEETKKAFTLLVNDETLEALLAIDRIDNHRKIELILLTFLYRFRDKEGNDKYAIKDQLSHLINLKRLKSPKTINRATMVLAVLGLYYGYRSLPKEESINITDRFFATFGENGNFNIKFKLDNLLERVIIEAVYQFCFWNNTNIDLESLKDFVKAVKYTLPEGYSDTNTFLILENNPIVRIEKSLDPSKIKTKAKLHEVTLAFAKLHEYLKSNALLKGDSTLDENELDVWLRKNSIHDLEKLLSQFKNGTDKNGSSFDL